MSDGSLRFPLEAAGSAEFAEDISSARDRGRTQGTVFNPGTARLDLETVYRIRRPELIRYLVSFGVDLVEAEDIVQEVFLNIFGRAQKQEVPDNNLFGWARVCAKNLAINRYRRSRREILAPANSWRQWEETVPDSRPTAEDRFQGAERYRKLTEWVSTLSECEQKCAVMRSQGIPFREMAVALDLPMRKVIYITSVAIQKLINRREGRAL